MHTLGLGPRVFLPVLLLLVPLLLLSTMTSLGNPLSCGPCFHNDEIFLHSTNIHVLHAFCRNEYTRACLLAEIFPTECHELEPAPTFRELFDRTHKQKGTDDYVSKSARMIAETCDRMMTDHYVESTHQPNMDPETLVDVVGGPKKGQVYSFGDNLDTIPMLSSYASSVAPPAYTSSSTGTVGGGGEDIRTLIREELSQQLPLHLGTMVEQLVAAIRGVGRS
ncbi:hypothetical protein Taro_002417 [Colocasia esculenta]|uniref:Uncharacterized protein n=1 Tax=Colocasia esculenta TaxID=4460 RepID=A0A843TH44_COLES|nr:hypothetical protein [Colocasia esculenta]